jgi:AraC-like DNA-binding protein
VTATESITVAAGTLLRVVEFCRRRGHDPEALCRDVGLSYRLLVERQDRFPLPLVYALCMRALEVSGDENFGLHLAEDVEDARNYDIGVLVMMASATLGEALDRFERNKRYWGDGDRMTLRKVTGGLALRSLMPGPSDAFSRHSHECALAEVVLGAKALCGQPVLPRVVRFAHASPKDVSEHQRIFGCPVEFAADVDELVFDDAVLTTPMRHANEAFLAVFEQQLEDALSRLPKAARTSDAVKSATRAALCNGGTTLAQSARALGLSERTLQRRLQDEGTSFAEIVDTARHEMATAYLARGLPVPAVSELLGYSDATAFHHAFRRWTGCSPADYLSGRTPKS